MLGGSSASNANLYIRGNSRDYNNWAALGNESWNWDVVLEYFKKSEDNRVEVAAKDTEQHATDGYLKVNYFYESEPLFRKLVDDLFSDLGYPLLSYGTGERLGFFRAMATVDKGTRQNAAKAFLIPAKERSNLHIIKYAHATKLNFKENDIVGGVTFKIEGHDTFLTVSAKKEVILSAGALNTPQILMLSGIGPRDHLTEHGITVRHDLVVGRNLQDHLIVGIPVLFHKSTALPYSKTERLIEDTFKYASNRTGRFASIGLTDHVGFISTVGDPEFADVQLHMFLFDRDNTDFEEVMIIYGMNEEIQRAHNNITAYGQTLSFQITLLNPKSSGRVELRSSNPFDKPKFYANYFAEQEDIDTTVRAIRFLQRIKKTPTFIANEGEFAEIKISTCNQHEYDSDAYWECYVRYLSSTLYHPLGTAKMVPSCDPTAVVNSRLRVHGVKGLRVVDASIMPKIVSGNTNAPTIMIAEKASDMVKEDWAKLSDASSKERVKTEL